MRKLIAAMKLSLDGKMEGPEGVADWAESWSEDYGLMPQIDACVLGNGMYGGYERYWTSIQNEPGTPAWITGNPPTPAEIAWAAFIKRTPHYVLSTTRTEAQWPDTRFLRGIDEIAALKRQPGKDIYVAGGGRMVTSLIDAGLLDELRLLVYPLIAGDGRALFATLEKRAALKLLKAKALPDGRTSLVYELGS